jgi:hypothetical protein
MIFLFRHVRIGGAAIWGGWFAKAGSVVNVAGPRESESPGIGERAEKFLGEVFQLPG